MNSGQVFVIAEAGVNHNGDPATALKLVDAAADAGADAVKFQTFTAASLATRAAPKAGYQKTTTDAAESQYHMLRRLELSRETHRALKARAAERGVAFLSSAFDVDAVRFLAGELGLDTVKIGSGEITNGPLLLAAAESGARVILSTGMSSLDEVADALGVLAYGYANPKSKPGAATFRRALKSPRGRAALRDRVILLHCTSQYPAPVVEANLRAMDTLAEMFGLPVGLSDHTEGIAVAIAAAALGAVAIEKHFTLDRTQAGPDHRASLEPAELAAMVRGIREAEAALGPGGKAPMPSELPTRDVARKSLVAARAVRKGERFDETNLTAKRPGGGISPMRYWDWLGAEAPRDFAADEMIAP